MYNKIIQKGKKKMAKILLDINEHGEFKKGDMLIYDGKNFVSVRKEHILSDIPRLYLKIEELQKEVKLIKASLDFDHGKITEQEYNEICGNK